MAEGIERSRELLRGVERELHKGIVGQEGLIRGLLIGLLADGHIRSRVWPVWTESPQSSGGGGGASEREPEGARGGSGDDEGAAAPQESAGDPKQQAQQPGDAGDQDSEKGEDGGGGVDLTDTELQQIRQLLKALAEQGREPGKFHRRTLPEQFRKSDWSNPDATIWW